jgi:hypothetical protein
MDKVKFILMVAFLSFSVGLAAQSEKDIPIAFKVGNVNEIAKFFSSNVSLKILETEDIYSKAQAEMVLKEFMNNKLVKNYTQKHQGVSKNGAEFYIGKLNTSGGNFRIYYFIKKSNDQVQLQELRIEQDE